MSKLSDFYFFQKDGRTLQTRTFTSSGVFNDYIGDVWVLLVGGGGGGGGSNNIYYGGSGGQGGEIKFTPTPLHITESISVTIGNGGIGGNTTTASMNGSNGQASTFGSLLSANGGFAGGRQYPPTGTDDKFPAATLAGIGGNQSNGAAGADSWWNGHGGTYGLKYSTVYGGGGGGGGSYGGGGAGGNGYYTASANGHSADNNTGGGGGGQGGITGNYGGGHGGSGICIVYWYE